MSKHSSTGPTPIGGGGSGGSGADGGGQAGGKKGKPKGQDEPSADDLLAKKPMPGARMKLS